MSLCVRTPEKNIKVHVNRSLEILNLNMANVEKNGRDGGQGVIKR